LALFGAGVMRGGGLASEFPENTENNREFCKSPIDWAHSRDDWSAAARSEDEGSEDEGRLRI
jgi:hypothetical protein